MTLEKALTYAKQSEAIKKQQLALRKNANVADVGSSYWKWQNISAEGNRNANCKWCGSSRLHGWDRCPAKNEICGICGVKGMYFFKNRSQNV